jgi:transcriptional regulator with XRE-family HTH domain
VVDPEGDLGYLRSVGLRVKILRITRGMSQGELGAAAGVSRVTVGSIERGDHPASVLAYRRLALAFGVGLSELLDERVPPPA